MYSTGSVAETRESIVRAVVWKSNFRTAIKDITNIL